ncbi:MAG: prephenate dehydratase [Gemmatimonadota bacterium]
MANADQNPPRVAFQGELGAFSEEAVVSFFGSAAEPLPRRNFADVVDSVRRGEADFGLLPIENTTVGGVAAACDALAESELNVIGEVIGLVRHCLLARPGTDFTDVRRVHSHPVALGQCSNFFRQHPQIEAIAAYDTAGAALQVSQSNDPSLAAIASGRAAERYGLIKLLEDFQDRADNQTRFLIVSRESLQPIEADAGNFKTALVLETENGPGALVNALLPLARHQLNLTHLQARPGHTPWSYWFFLEIEGAGATTELAVQQLAACTLSLRVLGSFPRWRP